MNVSENGLALIKRFEGCRLSAYQDSVGAWTIGYGHTDGVQPGDKISQEEADRLLTEDAAAFGEEVMILVTVPLNQNQFDALVSFTYNLGANNLKSSTLLRRLNEGNYRAAADQFTRWVFANNRYLPGLKVRREAERDLFLS
ncbi:lysozyme [Jejubacter calystegiae]|uniref:Lysozyme n=1 Tax=Jejubacter calystegiae TaxID=2579935 RepID=A0A4P8YKZ1_9ENTR|nr:lysozyme [Jejubacter calystegiae]QCT20823.1 lysozyme [Jejubacter calystegiae]